MEKSHAGKRHSDISLVTRFNNQVVSNRATWFYYVRNATLCCAFNIVAKWEESITTKRYTTYL
jgi:hypothetical protein